MHKPIFPWGAAAAATASSKQQAAKQLWGDELTLGGDPIRLFSLSLSLSSFPSLCLSVSLSLFLSVVSLTRPVSQADIGKREKIENGITNQLTQTQPPKAR